VRCQHRGDQPGARPRCGWRSRQPGIDTMVGRRISPASRNQECPQRGSPSMKNNATLLKLVRMGDGLSSPCRACPRSLPLACSRSPAPARPLACSRSRLLPLACSRSPAPARPLALARSRSPARARPLALARSRSPARARPLALAQPACLITDTLRMKAQIIETGFAREISVLIQNLKGPDYFSTYFYRTFKRESTVSLPNCHLK
jgi:hypothetical protein